MFVIVCFAADADKELLAKYIRRVRALPVLDAQEEYQLAKDWREKGDQKAVDKLIASHLKLVAKIASGYRGYGLPLSDLVAEGNLGMMHAMKHYDPERGFRFSTYAMWWIKANIQEYILRSWSLVKMGTTAAQRKLFFNLRRMKSKLDRYGEHDLSPEDVKMIAEKLSVKEEEVRQMNARLSTADYSLNAPRHSEEDGGEDWIEWIEDEAENQETHLLHMDEMDKRRRLFEKALASLSARESAIFVDRRLKEPPLTLETIAQKHDISRERVRQIEAGAFEKLQKAIKRLSRAAHEEI